MHKPPRGSLFAFPIMMTTLAATSWETIWRRTMMMAQGTCSPAEYRRMVAEKSSALRSSAAALMAGRSNTAVLAPFVTRTRANVKRLRRKP